jgi:DNA-binding NarL/FixJ family response regulator
MNTTDQVRILIVGEPPAGPQLGSMLESDGHLEIVGDADALEATRQLLEDTPRTEVLVIAKFPSLETAQQAVQEIRRTQSADELRTPTVTPREREIVALLCDGHSNKETARALNISVKTVEAHRLNIMRKLRLTSLSQLVRYAIREGIIAG